MQETLTTTSIQHLAIRDHHLESVLLEDNSVYDCAVLKRKNLLHKECIVAYIVPINSFSLSNIQSFLATKLTSEQRPDYIVPISAIPLTATGLIDVYKLSQIEILDEDVAQKIKETFQAVYSDSEITLDFEQPYAEIATASFHNENIFEFNELPQVTSNLVVEKEKPLSLIHGNALDFSKLPQTLSAVLQTIVNNYPLNHIKYEQSNHIQTYAALVETAMQISEYLKQCGLNPKDKIIFQLNDKKDFISAFWGCILGGFIPVAASPIATDDANHASVKKLVNTWKKLNKATLLTDKALLPTLSAVFKTSSATCLSIEEATNIAAFSTDTVYQAEPDDIALLLLTSGSTNEPKVVAQTHRSLIARSEGSAQLNHFNAADIFLNWFPLDHVGGLVMFHLQALYVGANQIQAGMEKVLHNPLTWLDWIEKFKATVTWAPNSFYALINNCENEIKTRKWNLSSMRFILNGGEAIVPKQATKFMNLLAPSKLSPQAMFPAWGMSETCSGILFSHNFSAQNTQENAAMVEVGLPISGVSIRIVNDANQLVAEGTIGQLQVTGLAITPGYYENSEENQHSFTQDGWFKTQDLAVMSQGRVTITGRDKDSIIINGLNFYSHEIEALIEELSGVETSFTAAIAIRDNHSATDQLIILFATQEIHRRNIENLIHNIRKKIIHQFNIVPACIIPIDKAAIPKTNIGKIQRAQLKKQFESNGFAQIMHRYATINLIPDWFHEKHWFKKEIASSDSTLIQPVIVFSDTRGLGTALCEYFSTQNIQFIKVEMGEHYQEIAHNHFQISPAKLADYQQLFQSISQYFKCSVKQIVYLWHYDSSDLSSLQAKDIQQNCIDQSFNIINLMKTYAASNALKEPLKFTYVSYCNKKVLPNDVIFYDKASIDAIVKTLSQEYPWIRTNQIDFDSFEQTQNFTILCKELMSVTKEAEIAYRGNERFVAGLVKLNPHLGTEPLQLQHNAMYLITGGLGGIGVHLAEYLLKNYNAKLLLMGRKIIPDRNLWQQYLEDGDALSVEIKALQRLQKIAKGEIFYASVDISQPAQLAQVVESVENAWNQKLAGILHLAGSFEQSSLSEISTDSMEKTINAKVTGTIHLHNLLKQRKQGIFLAFSSVNGFFGGANVGAYAVANAFVDNYVIAHDHIDGVRTMSLGWSMWDEVGMSRGFYAKELTSLKGFHVLNPKQAIKSFATAITLNKTHILIGLNSYNPNVMHLMLDANFPAQQLYVNCRTANASHKLEQPLHTFHDVFGHPVHYQFRFKEQEKSNILSGIQSNVTIETKLKTIWSTILDLEDLSLEDNFFDVGGHSLLMMKVQEAVKQQFQTEVSMVELFKHASIRSLAALLLSKLDATPNIENIILTIWKDVLELDTFDAHDNFFDLGGHSLSMMKVQSRIQSQLQIEISMVDLFKHSSLSKLLAFISEIILHKNAEKIDENDQINSRVQQRNLRLKQIK